MPESYKSLTESSEEDVGNDIEYVRYRNLQKPISLYNTTVIP